METLEKQLKTHIQYNLFPPRKLDYIPYLIEAIAWAKKGQMEHTIQFKTGYTQSVQELVDVFNLKSFIE